MILGVSPLRGFPVERRGICHLVPILGGRRLAGLVRLGGGVCPSAGCPVGTVLSLVGPAPTLHGALGGRRAYAGYGRASGASVSAQPSAGRARALWPHRDTMMRCSCRELKPLSVASVLGVSIHASLPCVRVEQTLAV